MSDFQNLVFKNKLTQESIPSNQSTDTDSNDDFTPKSSGLQQQIKPIKNFKVGSPKLVNNNTPRQKDTFRSHRHIEIPKSEYSLPPMSQCCPEKKYTLVLDLDETLIHTFQVQGNAAQFIVRPYCFSFIKKLSQHYEIVVFTAAAQHYADAIIDIIDPNRCIAHRLYRNHTTNMDGIMLKDLTQLGRDLSKTLIVDNLEESFSLQPENGYLIEDYVGQENDKCLKDLSVLLNRIISYGVEDVRKVLCKADYIIEAAIKAKKAKREKKIMVEQFQNMQLAQTPKVTKQQKSISNLKSEENNVESQQLNKQQLSHNLKSKSQCSLGKTSELSKNLSNKQLSAQQYFQKKNADIFLRPSNAQKCLQI